MSLKFVVLTLLNKQPQTGYEIVKIFDSAVGYFWHASHQQVYRELSQLTETKLVSFKTQRQDEKPDKKIYRITADGRKALQQWLESPLQRRGNKDALLVKLLSAESTNKSLLLAEIEHEMERVRSLLAEYQNIQQCYYSAEKLKGMPAGDKILYLALRKGIRGAEANLAWLEEAVETVTEL